jgi:uridine monophosphate synthetase
MMPSRLSFQDRADKCTAPLGKKLLRLLHNKKTNLALSADVTTSSELIMLADTLGPEICILKTHIDIIEDFTPLLTKTLRALADQHQFLIFEDRKFADIGHTVKHQYAGGMYHIADWADMVNAHCLPGPGIIQGLAEIGLPKNHGLVLLAEMSSAGHLMTERYMQQTLSFAEQFPDFVIGFITQHALSDAPHWINMTPGIQLTSGGDKLGQQYITPEIAINEHHTDIIIVGRGIISATNPLLVAKKYRERGWQAYQQSLALGTIRQIF